jgi:hypothetical protein
MSDETYLFSMFKGQEMLFEKELPIADLVPTDVLDLIEKYKTNNLVKKSINHEL